MRIILKTAVLALCLSGLGIYAVPSVQAQDSTSKAPSRSSKPVQRIDYKSPPSPELLAKQRGASVPQKTQKTPKTAQKSKAAPSTTPRATRKVAPRKAKKRKAREMPL